MGFNRLNAKIVSNLAALLILIVCLFNTSSDCFAAWSDVNIWLNNGMKKYRQAGEDGTSGANTLAIKCAKNEFEPFQIMIYNNHASDAITGVDVTVTEGTGTITDIYIYKELYINAATASRHDYGTGYYPDPLIPKVDRYYGETRNVFPFDVAAKKVQGVWVDIGTTSTTPAGTYTFNVSVTKSGETSKTATVTLQVWNFTLPSTPTLPSFLMVAAYDLDTGHYGSTTPPGGADSWSNSMRKLYYKALMYHRLGPQTNHNDLWFTNIDGSGHVTSWTDWDNYFGDILDGTIISSGPLAGTKVAALTIEFGNNMTSRDASQSNWINYLQDWWDHFTTKGWAPRTRLYLYTVDEPTTDTWSYRGGTYTGYQVDLMKCADMNSVTTSGAAWKNGFVTSRRVTQLSSPGGSYTSLDTTGIYMPVTCTYVYRYPWNTSDQATLRNTYPNYPNFTNRDHMGYVSNQGSHGPWGSPDSNGVYQDDNAPDLMIETPPVLTRGYFWLQWFYRVHGFLYYYTNSMYTAAPYNSLWSVYHGNGDGNLFFPGVPDKTGRTGLPASTPAIGGTHDIPIESIRLKLIRKGIEDREYMELLMTARDATTVDGQVNTLFSTLINDDTHAGPYYTIKTASDLATARENIANLLSGQPSPMPSAPTGLRIY